MLKNQNKREDLFYLDFIFYNLHGESLIDTGSNYCIISKDSIKKFDLNDIKIKPNSLKTASNTSIVTNSKVITQIEFSENSLIKIQYRVFCSGIFTNRYFDRKWFFKIE
ncbi:hypothetical protein DMUE_4172 [Dictyocoela muelleri]|nr:hypothetical protein DMUE_4172 [Dictyocoela muelleri]